MLKKPVVGGIVLLVLFSSVIPIVSSDISDSKSKKTLYYADASLSYIKERISPHIIFFNKHVHIHSENPFVHFDANSNEANLEIVMNYAAEMNYSAGFPFVILAPLVAFGLKIENYTDYAWDSFKLKHNGYAKREGNLSVEISFDMLNIESEDELILQPSVVVIGDPQIYLSSDFPREIRFTSLLLRFAYNLPSFNKQLLNNMILPFFAQYNTFESMEIHVKFD